MLDNTILTISVPATSANIGVGYDTLGLAFNLRAKIAFRESPALIIDGCPEKTTLYGRRTFAPAKS